MAGAFAAQRAHCGDCELDFTMSSRKLAIEPAVLATNPGGRPKDLRTAALVLGVSEHRVVTQEGVHELDGISSHSSHAPYYIHELVSDLYPNINVGDVSEIDEDREVPLEICHVIVYGLRAHCEYSLAKNESVSR